MLLKCQAFSLCYLTQQLCIYIYICIFYIYIYYIYMHVIINIYNLCVCLSHSLPPFFSLNHTHTPSLSLSIYLSKVILSSKSTAFFQYVRQSIYDTSLSHPTKIKKQEKKKQKKKKRRLNLIQPTVKKKEDNPVHLSSKFVRHLFSISHLNWGFFQT